MIQIYFLMAINWVILYISCNSIKCFYHFNKGGCCCSLRFGFFNCNCNFFNCNCDTEDGYCQYSGCAGPGCKCDSHHKELACGSRSRVIELEVFAKKSVSFYLTNDKL